VLKDFLYLNEMSLAQYVSQVEDGLRSERSNSSGSTKNREGKIGGGSVPASAGGGSGHTEEETVSVADTPHAQFERLLKAVKGKEDDFGWFDVLDHDSELRSIPIGSFVALDAEVHIPAMSKALSSAGDLKGTLAAFRGMAQLMEAAGQPTPANMPDSSQLDMLGSVADLVAGTESFIGEFDSSDWKITGTLENRPQRDDFDGFARVVGKVASLVSPGSSKPLFNLPGQQLMSRDQRRAFERKGPSAGQEGNWVSGPAVVLNVLAIYR
jgi:hypothetical protein